MSSNYGIGRAELPYREDLTPFHRVADAFYDGYIGIRNIPGRRLPFSDEKFTPSDILFDPVVIGMSLGRYGWGYSRKPRDKEVWVVKGDVPEGLEDYAQVEDVDKSLGAGLIRLSRAVRNSLMLLKDYNDKNKPLGGARITSPVHGVALFHELVLAGFDPPDWN